MLTTVDDGADAIGVVPNNGGNRQYAVVLGEQPANAAVGAFNLGAAVPIEMFEFVEG